MPRFLLVFLLAWMGCQLSRSYEMRGRIVGFGDDGRTVFIAHEAVPGYMPAMTMPFHTVDTTALQSLSLGDAVQFTFHVTRDSSWITNIRRLPPGTSLTLAEGERPTLHGLPLLEEGDPLPGVTLLTQDSTTLRTTDLKGQAVVLTFIYTRCPVPDFCPRMSENFQKLQTLVQQHFPGRARLLTISFDPAHDTPAVLRRYAQRYTTDTQSWTFATGDTTTIRQLATQFGVHYQDEGVEIVHNLSTALITPDGRIARIWRGNRWKPEDVLQTLAEVLQSE
ncbi:SCO family protein [Rhodothermus bifroesti]|uniref:Redoxin domain-containing protein n=1 Tax=Rhodothermus marinus TaxID=29549 RepID=A0A7V2AYV8_RHOMR|nr:SCO family protein [Rhodothermus bifroesti]GBD00764.1 SCO1 protein [bacterium HR18]